MTLLLIGFIGSGKTSIGLELSKDLQMEFYEMDELVYRHTGVQDYSKIKDSLWRECQLEICKDLSSLNNIVVSCSGDIVENNLNLTYFKENSLEVKIIFVTASEEILIKRLQQKNSNLDHDKAKEKIQELTHKRLELYKSVADITIDTSKLSVSQSVNLIKNFLSK